MSKSTPSLVDVAARAKVSAGTASHVLNRNHKARISPATQERVRQAAQELGYRPNSFARSLLGKKTKTLGLMCSTFENPFFVSVARVAWQRASKIGYQLLLDSQFVASGQFRDYARIGPWPVDGLLLWADTVQDIEMLLGRQAQGLPVIYLGLTTDAQCDCVTFDFYAGMRRIMEHLAEKGYKKPMMAARDNREQDLSDPRSRARAFHDYCLEHNLPGIFFSPPAHLSDNVAAFEAGLSIASKPASERPDVVVCYNDVTAIGVYHGLKRGGLRVPQDIGVTGYDGISEGQCLDLPLTTAAIPVDLACGSAIEMLVHRIEHGSNGQPNKMLLPIRLLEGATT